MGQIANPPINPVTRPKINAASNRPPKKAISSPFRDDLHLNGNYFPNGLHAHWHDLHGTVKQIAAA
jgi:hypothetical protein